MLSDVLALGSVRGAVAASVLAGQPWGLRLGAVPGAAFHAITDGTAWLTCDGQPACQLMPGDAVLLPHGSSHTLASARDALLRPFDHVRAEASLGGGGELVVGEPPTTTRILCASYSHDPASRVATFQLLPDVVHVPGLHAPPALRYCLQLLAAELDQPAPGQRAVLDHIVNVLLIHLLRAWIADDQVTSRPASWLRGLADPVVRTVLSELHADPARAWTTATLAARAGVSRATLGRRFRAEVGQTPGEYLTVWRIERAAHQLRGSDDAVGLIAHAVGYRSEYAFSRAFARRRGQPPGRYRSAHQLVGVRPDGIGS